MRTLRQDRGRKRRQCSQRTVSAERPTIFAPQIEEMADEKSQGGIKVLFILTDANGHVQVRDLKVEESSLLLSYRDRFYKMIHEDSDDDMTWFLEDLTTVTQDTEEKNAQKLNLL